MSGAINSNSFVSSVNAQSRFGASSNIPELIMAVQIERANVLENQIKDQIGDMQKRNEWLKTANAHLATLRTNRPNDTSALGNYYPASKPGEPSKKDTAEDAKKWMDANGVKIENTGSDSRGNQGEFDAAINNLKSSIDSVNSQSQMDMVRLQGLMDKRNQAFDMLTNNLSKFSKSMDSVIGNMR